jgi:mono/diheme cytochrome c family protein
MFKRIVNVVEVLAAIAAAVFVVLLFTNEPGGGSANGNASPGAALFASNCARCHGSDGGGGIGPQLSGGKVVKDFPKVSAQIALVRKGQDGMPGFGDQLSPAEIQQVVEYTRTL